MCDLFGELMIIVGYIGVIVVSVVSLVSEYL